MQTMRYIYSLSLILGIKKDPGIPNLYPFKDQLLRELEERKQRVHSIYCNTCKLLIGCRLRRPKDGRKRIDVKNT